MPIVISMKHLLEQKHSPLLKDLLLCLKEIMQVRGGGNVHVHLCTITTQICFSVINDCSCVILMILCLISCINLTNFRHS